jgi:hypothetical protein
MQYSQRDQNLFKMVPSKHKLNSNDRLFPCTAYLQQSTANTLPSPLHSAVPFVSIPVPAYQWELPGNLQIRNILFSPPLPSNSNESSASHFVPPPVLSLSVCHFLAIEDLTF